MPDRIPKGFNLLELVEKFYQDNDIKYTQDSLKKFANLVSRVIPFDTEQILVGEIHSGMAKIVGEEKFSYEKAVEYAKYSANTKYEWALELYLELSGIDLVTKTREEAIRSVTKHLQTYKKIRKEKKQEFPQVCLDILANLKRVEQFVKVVYPKVKEFREKEGGKPKEKSAVDEYLAVFGKK